MDSPGLTLIPTTGYTHRFLVRLGYRLYLYHPVGYVFFWPCDTIYSVLDLEILFPYNSSVLLR